MMRFVVAALTAAALPTVAHAQAAPEPASKMECCKAMKSHGDGCCCCDKEVAKPGQQDSGKATAGERGTPQGHDHH